MTLAEMDRAIVGDLYFSSEGKRFLEELVDRFGSRFLGSSQERPAAEFIRDRFAGYGADSAALESFTCPGWIRKETRLLVRRPVERAVNCIALPYCPTGDVEGPLLDVGAGAPATYAELRGAMKGAIVMATTVTPRSRDSRMHRTEKLGRALDAGAVGFIWMRGLPGGLPETGAAQIGRFCEIPAIAVSYEDGYALQRLSARGPAVVAIHSTNENRMVSTQNVVAEVRGRTHPEELIVLGAHYDGHDIGQGAMDNGAGVAVLMEVARVLRPYRSQFQRTLRFVAFAGEELGLHGSHEYGTRHGAEPIRFMLNLDGAARSPTARLHIAPAFPDAVDFVGGLYDGPVDDDAALWLHSDHYYFSAQGIPAAIVMSDQPAGSSAAAVRGYGHTAMDTLDKVSGEAIEMEASRVARLALRLLSLDTLSLARQTPAHVRAVLEGMGLDEVLRYEQRALPGER
ncbi:MAG TPA: M28 family peptidase [bacterium]|nr:M28 family peptidase [bacterium]